MLDEVVKLSQLVIAAAAVVGVYNYYDQVAADRVDRVYSLQVQYNGADMVDARKRINGLVHELLISEHATSGDAFTKALLDRFGNTDTRISADLLVQFFERLHSCQLSRACDGHTVETLFADEAQEFYGKLFPLIGQVRESDPRYARGLQCIMLKSTKRTAEIDCR